MERPILLKFSLTDQAGKTYFNVDAPASSAEATRVANAVMGMLDGKPVGWESSVALLHPGPDGIWNGEPH